MSVTTSRVPGLSSRVASGLLLAVMLGSCERDTSSTPVSRRADRAEPVAAGAPVVVLLVDTLRADWLGAYGASPSASPNIDRLAREGVVFEAAHAPAPWTLPSVTSLMTGRFPVEHGVVVDGQKVGRELGTLAEALQAQGYRTASFHVNPYAGPMSGLDRGFEECTAVGNDGAVRRAGQWLAGIDGPFFLYLHVTHPHDPYRFVSAEWKAAAAGEVEAVEAQATEYRQLTRADFVSRQPPGTADNSARQTELLAAAAARREFLGRMYTEALKAADDVAGELRALLERRGLWDDTLFVLVSDHGEEMADHGGWLHDQSVYEELVHVPFVLRLPGGREGGRRVERPVSLVHFAATLLHAVGVEAASLPGQDLLAAPSDPEAGAEGLQVTAMRINRKKYYRPYKEQRGDVNVVVRRGSWKGILNAELGHLELYDLDRDPDERHDLAAEEPEVAGSMARFAADEWERLRARAVQAEDAGLEALDDATWSRLQELGYVGPRDEH